MFSDVSRSRGTKQSSDSHLEKEILSDRVYLDPKIVSSDRRRAQKSMTAGKWK